MTHAQSIRHNAKIIMKQVRGKSKAERWQIYARLMLGLLSPIVEVSRVWRDGRFVFDAEPSVTWAQARNR